MAECSTLSINFNNESEYYLALLLKNFNDVKPFFFQDTGNSFHALIHLFLMFFYFFRAFVKLCEKQNKLSTEILVEHEVCFGSLLTCET